METEIHRDSHLSKHRNGEYAGKRRGDHQIEYLPESDNNEWAVFLKGEVGQRGDAVTRDAVKVEDLF